MNAAEIFDAVRSLSIPAVLAAIKSGSDTSSIREWEGSVLEAAIRPNPLTTSNARNRIPASATQIIIIALLLTNGARHNPSNSPMGSAVTAAAYLEYVDILKALVEAGCSANPPPGRFGTPIIAAAEAGQIAAVKLLLEKGVDPNAISNEGLYRTPLEAAIKMSRSVKPLKVLMDAGAKDYGTVLEDKVKQRLVITFWMLFCVCIAI
ncbi:hypothetical protein FPQ18DRAFT_332540 [Pyronema domesticum]|uniref:Similar to Putative ankyrin repeat protein FPV228 acc. no. Q9J507 n=1 Tax=Pyronema omphalodes (strain CBS 100304) TaxID=1076935 RepID=U4L1Y1_PYROM|nr:hypothetical protein FPQ18DRAFT_332540 [Pyronema domesticum]CCX09661.1 Similar to Putative ankyrin repeat protein FPV228; acc. no. Q9J507 [Pyronema omphalodes CBS 100304]